MHFFVLNQHFCEWLIGATLKPQAPPPPGLVLLAHPKPHTP
jgi:hypothetical protein